MDAKLAEVRKAAAARYKQTPEEQKPHITKCEACGQPDYLAKVCPETGLLHQKDKKRLVGGMLMDADSKQMTGGQLMNAINAIRVRWQKPRVQKLTVDGDSIGIFQTFVMRMQWQLMRFGYMYGTVSEDGTQVTVDAIYEPEQQGTNMDFELLPDKRMEKVDEIAKGLGLCRVGICCTHQPRDPNQIVLSGKELLLLAKEQSRFGDHCVLITIGPDMENQQIAAQAWQGSQQCVNLFQLGILEESKEDIRYIHSTTPLEIAQDTTDEKGHNKCVIKEPAATVDTRWCTAPVAVDRYASPIIRNTFARISRPGEAPPTMANLRIYFQDPRRSRLPFVERIADFHVLIFLRENLFGKSDMPTVLTAVLEKNNSAVEIYDEMIREHFKQLH